jgi:hypothetical protein
MMYFLRQLGLSMILSGVAVMALADEHRAPVESGRKFSPWLLEFKIGEFEPDLELYQDFYGDKSDLYISGAFGRRFKPWLELAGELGYFHDTGVGVQATNGMQGGQVKYKLFPAHVYVNFRGEFSQPQILVPYGGVGLTSAWYSQKIEGQGDKSGRTDLGYNARLGVELNLNRLDARSAKRARDQSLTRSYLYLEAQYFTTEVDGIDLGGVAYMLGLRLEFDFGVGERMENRTAKK